MIEHDANVGTIAVAEQNRPAGRGTWRNTWVSAACQKRHSVAVKGGKSSFSMASLLLKISLGNPARLGIEPHCAI